MLLLPSSARYAEPHFQVFQFVRQIRTALSEVILLNFEMKKTMMCINQAQFIGSSEEHQIPCSLYFDIFVRYILSKSFFFDGREIATHAVRCCIFTVTLYTICVVYCRKSQNRSVKRFLKNSNASRSLTLSVTFKKQSESSAKVLTSADVLNEQEATLTKPLLSTSARDEIRLEESLGYSIPAVSSLKSAIIDERERQMSSDSYTFELEQLSRT